MQKILTKVPKVRTTCKEALALFLWRFKKNALVLLPVIFFQIYMQYKMISLLPDLSSENPALAIMGLWKVFGWYVLLSTVLLMVYADITRRLCNLPVQLETSQAWLAYAYWLFKKSVIVMTVLSIAGLFWMFMMGILVVATGFLMRITGAVTFDPMAWTSILLIVAVLASLIFIIAYYALICYPIAIDKNTGPIDGLRLGLKLVRPYRRYSYQMAMIVFLLMFLPNFLLSADIFRNFFSLKAGMTFTQFMPPALVTTVLADFIALFVLCLQVSAYRALDRLD
jgi:hypothetical protein